jgi:hypothetical protein
LQRNSPGDGERSVWAIHTIIGIPFVLIQIFFVVFQGGTGALLEHVERLLDVVGCARRDRRRRRLLLLRPR